MDDTEGISKAAIRGDIVSGASKHPGSHTRGQVRIVTMLERRTEPESICASSARISLKPHTEHPGMVNGAWWPRSRDLAAELPPLIAALDAAWGQIHRVTVNVRMWPEIPRRLVTGLHTVRVGWFDAEQDRHDLCLLSHSCAPYRWDLVVVPPETDPERAERLMASAADVRNKQTASALVAGALAGPRDGSWDLARIREWEFEGGGARGRAPAAESAPV